MANEKVFVAKVSKNKNQSRITVPRDWKSDYVIMKPFNPPNVFKSKKRYYDKD